ncbi:hypothetical protein L7F22_066100 [Adiantum nelumboides]|nr:hypothetical protein [Adiantum nelumboides]
MMKNINEEEEVHKGISGASKQNEEIEQEMKTCNEESCCASSDEDLQKQSTLHKDKDRDEEEASNVNQDNKETGTSIDKINKDDEDIEDSSIIGSTHTGIIGTKVDCETKDYMDGVHDLTKHLETTSSPNKEEELKELEDETKSKEINKVLEIGSCILEEVLDAGKSKQTAEVADIENKNDGDEMILEGDMQGEEQVFTRGEKEKGQKRDATKLFKSPIVDRVEADSRDCWNMLQPPQLNTLFTIDGMKFEIKTSTIPNTGYGLFAHDNSRESQFLMYYIGIKLDYDSWKTMCAKNPRVKMYSIVEDPNVDKDEDLLYVYGDALGSDTHGTQDGGLFLVVVFRAVLAVCVGLSLKLSRRLSARGSRLPPGPPAWRVIGNFHLLGAMPLQSLTHLARRYGPLMSMRLGSILYIVALTPEMGRYFLQTYDHCFVSRLRTAAATQILFNSTDLAFAPYGPYWTLIRRACVKDIFHPKRLLSFQPIRRQETRNLIHGLLQQSSSGHPIVLRPHMQGAANNIIFRMTFSKTYSELSSSSSTGDIVAIIDEIMHLLGVPNVGDVIPSLAWLDLQGLERKMRAVREQVKVALGEIIRERRDRNAEQDVAHADQPQDFLDALLSMQKTEREVGITDDNVTAVILVSFYCHIRVLQGSGPLSVFSLHSRYCVWAQLMQDMYVGGTDTTSITSEWALAKLLANPACLEKVQEELDRLVGRERPVKDGYSAAALLASGRAGDIPAVSCGATPASAKLYRRAL